MIKLYASIFTISLTTLSLSQYCVSNVGPTSTIDSNVQGVSITGASGSINYTGCPGVVGVQDLTFMNTALNAGGSYSITVQFGTCGGSYSGAGQVWIDFNQNFIFEASESIGTWTGIPPVAPSTFNFTVPAGATNGTTRMRVTQQEGTSVLPLNPCAQFAWGSVMDFSITIGNGIDCTGYTGDDTNDPIIVSSLPYTGTGDNSFCYSNQNLVYNSPDIYYQITPSPLMHSINVSLCGSSFDTFLSVIDPAGNVIAFNDDVEGCGTSSGLTFDPQGLGLLYVIVEGWNNAQGEYSIAINANYLGEEDLDMGTFKVYPNPTEGLIHFTGIEGTVELMSLAGQKIEQINASTQKTYDLSHLPKGIYLLKFQSGDKTLTEKIVLK